jgi:hypothetical protein
MVAAMLGPDDPTAPIAFAQQLSGRLTTIGPGLADLDLAGDAPTPLGSGIRLAARLTFASERRFRERGTLAVAGGDVLALASLGDGDLDEAGGDARHGTAVLGITGLGALAGAHGRITCNFVVSGDGCVIDRQVLVLFCGNHHTNEGGRS